LKKVLIYADGACSGNPGPGGWGAILRYGKHYQEISGGEAETTNNRMELLGVINALEKLKEPCEVTLFTDSQYISNAINKGWLEAWRAKGWVRKDGELKNPDLWQRLWELLQKNTVRVNWVKGHAGHAENERCDELARQAAKDASSAK